MSSSIHISTLKYTQNSILINQILKWKHFTRYFGEKNSFFLHTLKIKGIQPFSPTILNGQFWALLAAQVYIPLNSFSISSEISSKLSLSPLSSVYKPNSLLIILHLKVAREKHLLRPRLNLLHELALSQDRLMLKY